MKPKVALYWCASCGGCEEAVVDLAEAILDVVEKVDIVFWPVAMDFKREDVEALEDGEIVASFINGAIRFSEHVEMVELLRKKSKLVFAFGACACFGGIPGLANCCSSDEIFDYVYRDSPTVVNPDDVRPTPGCEACNVRLDVPEFLDECKALDEVIDVDYYIPGCPPSVNIIVDAFTALLEGNLPPKGSVLASQKSVCHDCRLNETKPEKILIKEFKRVWEAEPEPDKCLLAQGFLCLGPVTRGGCGALCVGGNMPCTGCFGPLDGVMDYGAKALSYIASIVDSMDEEEIDRILEKIPDPLGLFYKYSLPKSLLGGRIRRVAGGDDV
ncbi:NADH-quinone oxidoreductase subunit B family protein [Archaeoglobus veneficus]|uniref:NADH ubiquinone oxidoreductase 20 kDa subunit n=1 Tax=Archaeoglobus veneficus (strain DSM 11195 / SNP6) TaxID=693661 RepID=F2KPP1_ARCVS|nr:oxidoreductase [Archaeoglobus veneficus]AEA47569.1 NADH ubiquinone oxidoreductase 20 kDa subunit [Archaeoglobus veneficus SNP6]